MIFLTLSFLSFFWCYCTIINILKICINTNMCGRSQKRQSTRSGCVFDTAHESSSELFLIQKSTKILPCSYHRVATTILWTFWNVNLLTSVSRSFCDVHGHHVKHKHKYLTGFLRIARRNSDEKVKSPSASMVHTCKPSCSRSLAEDCSQA